MSSPDVTSQNVNSSQQSPAQKPRTQYLLIGSIVAIVVIVGIIISSAFWIYDYTKPVSQLTVSAQASAKFKPDQATANFYVSKIGTNSDQLNKDVDSATQKILDYLKTQNISQSDITTSKNSYPDYSTINYDAPDNSGSGSSIAKPIPAQTPQTQVEASFKVTLHNLQDDLIKPNAILQEVTKLGVNRFDSISYEISNRVQECQKLQDQAIKNGYDRAQSQVNSLGGGRIVRREVQSSGGDCGNNYEVYPITANGTADGDIKESTPPSVSTGEQELISQVSVVVQYK